MASYSIVVMNKFPDTFNTYEIYDFEYSISYGVRATSVATISYDWGGKKIVYSKTFTEHPAKIEDVGKILESKVRAGNNVFTLEITSDITDPFTLTFRVEYIQPVIELMNFHDLYFSSALDKIAFILKNARREDYSAKFTLLTNSETILSETYVPDLNNEIIIRDISSLINPYLKDVLVSNFSISISVFDKNTSEFFAPAYKSFKALYCEVVVDINAVDFIGRFFLSTLMGAKVTALGQKEYLHFATIDEDFVSGDENIIAYKVFAYYVNSEMKQVSNVINRNVSLNADNLQIVTIDASPHNFVEKGLTLVSYKVVVGNRIQMYYVGKRYDSEPDIAFKNSFGLLETLYFTGTKEEAPEMSRSAGYVNGEYRNYYIEENRVVKANTGIIPEAMVCLVDELARSTEAYLIEKGEIGRQITITDSELKRTNDLDSLYSFQITYRLSKRNQNVLKVQLPAKTFDSTFDKTFE